MKYTCRCYCSSSSTDLATVLDSLSSTVSGDPMSIVVNRRSVVKSVQWAMKRSDFSTVRPLRMLFSGEDAVDDGGLRQLLMFAKSQNRSLSIIATCDQSLENISCWNHTIQHRWKTWNGTENWHSTFCNLPCWMRMYCTKRPTDWWQENFHATWTWSHC